jgi:hypothetical protein
MGQRSEDLARRFEQAVAAFEQTVQACPDDKWHGPCDGGWTVAQMADHIAGQFPLEGEFFYAAAEGRDLPGHSWDEINKKNDDRAAAAQQITKDQVLKALRDSASPISGWIRGLSDEQLDRAAPLALADGAQVTTQRLLESGALIDHVGGGHLESIKKAIA